VGHWLCERPFQLLMVERKNPEKRNKEVSLSNNWLEKSFITMEVGGWGERGGLLLRVRTF